MNDQAFQLLMAQNSQTQQMISDLRKDLKTHYEADEKTNAKVVAMGATMRTLKWIIGVGLTVLSILAGHAHLSEALGRVFR